MFDQNQVILIAITDDLRDGVMGLVRRASAAAHGGATMLQLRLKHVEPAVQLEVARALIRAVSIPVLVNDRADIALAAGAAGVHLGADDVPVRAIRAITPPGFIIGASVGSESEVENSREADYVGIGPVFETATKEDAGKSIGPSGFALLARLCGKPAVAIGGIDATNASLLRGSGAAGLAVVRSVLGSADPEVAARSLRAAFQS